jgi:hypothetical protein
VFECPSDAYQAICHSRGVATAAPAVSTAGAK